MTVPTLSGLLIGFGLLSIFLQALNYLVDAYLMVSSTCSHTTPANRTTSLPHPLSQRIHSCVVFVELHSRFSRVRCSKVWVSNGLRLCLAVSPRFSYQCRFGSTSKVRRSERRVRLRRRFRNRRRLRRRVMGIRVLGGRSRDLKAVISALF